MSIPASLPVAGRQREHKDSTLILRSEGLSHTGISVEPTRLNQKVSAAETFQFRGSPASSASGLRPRQPLGVRMTLQPDSLLQRTHESEAGGRSQWQTQVDAGA